MTRREPRRDTRSGWDTSWHPSDRFNRNRTGFFGEFRMRLNELTDQVTKGGKWLAPQEVESCLLEHAAVDTAIVVGVRSEDGLIKPVAYVIASEPRPGLEDELMQWALDRLEAYKHPRRIYLVDSLPTTHLGKVDRTRLKKMAAG